MTQWKCQVCGYVHEGDEPPEACPVCGVGPDQFDRVDDAVTDDEPSESSESSEAAEPSEPAADRWRCSVCGYIHEGPEPPEVCPVCGVGPDKFQPAGEDEPQKVEPTDEEPPAGDDPDSVKATAVAADRAGPDDPTAEYKAIQPPPAVEEPSAISEPAWPEEDAAPVPAPTQRPRARGGKRWRCTVCNYIHEGDGPPDTCPLCGAGKDAFVLDEDSAEHGHEGLGGLIERLHAHPVTAHFPNGSLPLSLLFWIAFLVLGDDSLERTSFYLLLISAAVAPVTFLTGLSDASHRFGGIGTGVFPEKIRWGIALSVIGLGLAAWRLAAGWAWVPDTTTTIVLYTALLAAANGLAVRLGLLGGKLIFGH